MSTENPKPETHPPTWAAKETRNPQPTHPLTAGLMPLCGVGWGENASSAYITRSRSAQPIPSELVSDDSGAGSGSDCDGWVFDDDGGYDQDEAYELFQWAVE